MTDPPDDPRLGAHPSQVGQYGQPQQQWGQPSQYGPVPYPQYYPVYQRTNTLSIVAIILGFLVPPGGVICGHIALGQIKRTGENGRGLALTGLIAGYTITGLYALFILGYIATIIVVLSTAGVVSGYTS